MPKDQQASVIEHFNRISGKYADKYFDPYGAGHSYHIRCQRVYELIRSLKAGRILDIGCGPGITAEHFTSQGLEFFGVDASPDMIEQCCIKFARLERAHFSKGSAEKLEFPDSFFDAVVCMGAAEYLESDQPLLREIARVLKTGGIMIITLPNKLSPWRLWYRIVYRGITTPLKKFTAHKDRLTFRQREFSERAYAKLLTEQGFNIIDIVYYNFKVLFAPLDRIFPSISASISRRLEFLGRTRLKYLGTGFIVKARKV